MSWDGETPKWLVPRPTPEDREFWAGAHRGELRIQHCTTCGKHQHYARLLCSHCGEQSLEWVTASGNGTVYSFTVIRQNGVPPFNERIPFVVATVDLDEEGARGHCGDAGLRTRSRARRHARTRRVPARDRRTRLRRLRAGLRTRRAHRRVRRHRARRHDRDDKLGEHGFHFFGRAGRRRSRS